MNRPSHKRFLQALAIRLCVVLAGLWAVPRISQRLAPLSQDYALNRFAREVQGQRTQSTHLRIEPDLAAGRLQGQAELTVDVSGEPRRTFWFLLSSDLAVRSATVDGEPARVRRWGQTLWVTGPRDVAPGDQATVALDYSGAPSSGGPVPMELTDTEIFLPMLSLWYPMDLRSFGAFRCDVRLPDRIVPAVPGSRLAEQSNGSSVYTWEEPRPVLGASFAAGPYRKATRLHGAVRCTLFFKEDQGAQVDQLLDVTGKAYSTLNTLLGADGFGEVAVVIGDQTPRPTLAGNAVMALSPDREVQSAFVAAAESLARNWFGGTVGARWLTEKPEGARWLLDGLATHAAWMALEHAYGKQALVRYLQQRPRPRTMAVPMKTLGLRPYLTKHPTESGQSYDIDRLAYAARMLEARAGTEAFIEAARNVLRIYRHSSISSSAFIHELELACQEDLGEFTRLWFDRPGTFDYAVTAVEQAGDQLRVRIDNAANIPPLMELDLAVQSEGRVQHFKVDPGVHGGEFTFDVSGSIDSVLFDSDFFCPDSHLQNNIWPRRQWPASIAVASDERIAIRATTDGPGGGTAQTVVNVFDPSERSYHHIGPCEAAIWRPGSKDLILDPHGRRSWNIELGVTTAGPADSVVHCRLGDVEILVKRGEIGDDAVWSLRQADGRIEHLVVAPPPQPGAVAATTDARWLAYGVGASLKIIDTENRRLIDEQPELLSGCVPVWDTATETILFMTETGAQRYDPLAGQFDSVIELPYMIDTGAVAADAAHLAWTDPAGNLRCAFVDQPVPRLIRLSGDVISYAWAGGDALIALTAQELEGLPGRYAADYRLWRVPVATWQPESMDFRPGRPR